jgi:hypothetical protein
MRYPKWINVHQKLDRKVDPDPAETVRKQLASMAPPVKPGDRIAITAGSRYISNLVEMTKAVADYLKSRGAEPFLVPAMGSHGGATDQGQLKVLADFGFREQRLEVPIHASMDVVELGEVDGIPVFFDKNAYAADGIVVINRVKPHQFFKKDIQSGLNKMMALGLGKKKGADTIHGCGRTDILGDIGDFICSRTPILLGVAILENAYDETRNVAVLKPEKFKEIDATWAKKARSLMPKIPIRDLDLVIVEEMGKDISGSGMDTNVIGFTRRLNPSGQVAVALAVLDLTDRSGGNAIGIGLADFVTQRLVNKVDRQKTNINVIATGIYSAGRIPITLASEQEIIDVILAKMEKPENARIIRIKNTFRIDSFMATDSLLEDIDKNEALSVIGKPMDTVFNEERALVFEYQAADRRELTTARK